MWISRPPIGVGREKNEPEQANHHTQEAELAQIKVNQSKAQICGTKAKDNYEDANKTKTTAEQDKLTEGDSHMDVIKVF